MGNMDWAGKVDSAWLRAMVGFIVIPVINCK